MSGAQAPQAGNDNVTGFVEAVTADAVLGWVWHPGQAAPIRVELHDGATVVCTSVADLFREDLERSGIGSGHHAFSLPVPEGFGRRMHELSVVAIRDGAEPVQLQRPPQNHAAAEDLVRLHRGVDMLIASQRVLHRNLQSALLRPSAPTDDTASAQVSLRQQIETLELFLIRVENAMTAPRAVREAPRLSKSVKVLAGMAGAALVVSATALLEVMLRT